MFDKVLPFMKKDKEEEQIIKAEKRQQDFIKEQRVFDAASMDDQQYNYSQETKSDLLRWQQDLDDELKSLIEHLLGKELTKEGNWVEFSEPSCNEKFITKVVIPHCNPYMSRNLINTNWDERTILVSLKNSMNTVANAMADGFDEYDISFTDYDNVLSKIKTTCKAGAYRALNGWTKRIDSTMIKRIESMSEAGQYPQQKKGIWSVFKNA